MASSQVDAVLKDVTIKGVELLNEELGHGAYSKVFTVEYRGVVCAAKEIHPFLIETATPVDEKVIVDNFVRECYQYSLIRHPNIVQFLGVYYSSKKSKLPIMVMELMNTNLSSFVKGNHSKIVMNTKISILYDVSVGLNYLHNRNPVVIHRDLSPNNVMLTSTLIAKIGDLGVAKVIQANSRQLQTRSRLTKAPGTVDFMPPETLEASPVYGTAIDVFSFAAVALHIFAEEWPKPCGQKRRDPVTKKLVAITEVERRQKYLDKIPDGATALKHLFQRCLDDDPDERPPMQEILEMINKLKVTSQADSCVLNITLKTNIPISTASSSQSATVLSSSSSTVTFDYSTTLTTPIVMSPNMECIEVVSTASDNTVLSSSPVTTHSVLEYLTTSNNVVATSFPTNTSAADISTSKIQEKVAYEERRLQKGFKYQQPRALPPNHIKRQLLLDEIATKLLQATIDPDKYGTTLAITGAGGFGKTSIVTSLCYHPLIKKQFTDGFVFIELGQQAPDPSVKLKAIYRLLANEQCDINVVEPKIKQLTSDYYRNLLVIIDDVWLVEDVEPLLRAFSNCKTIITTRMNDIDQYIPSKNLVIVGPMTQNEAVSLLTPSRVIDINKLSQADVNLLHKLAQDVHLWPLPLSLIRGMLSHILKQNDFSQHQAIQYVKAELHHKGLTAFDMSHGDINRKLAACACIEITLKLLPKALLDKYKSLILWTGIGTSIQTDVLNNLWSISKQQAEKTVDALWGYGLVQFNDITVSPNNNTQQCVEVHDVISQYIIENMESGEFISLSPLNVAESVKIGLKRTFQQTYGVYDLSRLSAMDYIKYIQSEIENVLLPYYIKLINNHVITDPHGIILMLQETKRILVSLPYAIDMLSLFGEEIDPLIANCKLLLQNASMLCKKLSQNVFKNLYEKNYDRLIQSVEEFIKNYSLCGIAHNAVTVLEKIILYCDGEILQKIKFKCEQIYMVTPDYHYITTLILPTIKLFIRHHRQISASLCNGSPDIELTYYYILSDKCKEEFELLDINHSIKIQGVAPILAANYADDPIGGALESPSPINAGNNNDDVNALAMQQSLIIPAASDTKPVDISVSQDFFESISSHAEPDINHLTYFEMADKCLQGSKVRNLTLFDNSSQVLRYLQPRYLDIIKSLPESVEHTINKLEAVFTDECLINILSATDSDAANKILLDYLIKDMSTSEDLLDLCNQLEKITESPNLVTTIAEMRAAIVDALHHDHDVSDLPSVPEKLFTNKDLHILQRRYTALLQSFPVTHLSTLECLQNFLTDGCICAVVESTDVSLTNKMMLDCMISKLTCKEDLLDFFDKLKEIKNADALTSIVNELLQELQHIFETDTVCIQQLHPNSTGDSKLDVSVSNMKRKLVHNSDKTTHLHKEFKYLQPPPLPTIHVNRQILLNEIVKKLLQATNDPNKFETTLTITGAGGFGKTTIVASLCYHHIVKETFTDGFLFVELGQQATDPSIKLRAIYNLLTDEQCDINIVEQKLTQLTSDYYHNLLVIIDDVWHVEDASPFVKVFSSCKIILTTRMKNIEQHIPSKQSVMIGPMEQNEAISLLTSGVFDSSQLSQMDINLLNKLAQDVHLWPLLLSLIRGQLSHYVKIRHFSNRTAIKSVQDNLHHEGVTALDVHKSRKLAVKSCIEFTLQLLPKSLSEKIKMLVLWTGIGTSLQVAVLSYLWNISKQEAEEIIDKLWAYGLVQFTDATISPDNITQHCVEVHAVISQYIIDVMDSSEAYSLSPIIGKVSIIESVSTGLTLTYQRSCGIRDLSSLPAIDNLKYQLMEIENVAFPFCLKLVNLYTVNDPHNIILRLREIKDNLIRSPYLLELLCKEIDSLMAECKQILNDAYKLCRTLNQIVQRNLIEKNYYKLIQIVEEYIRKYPVCHIAQKATTMVVKKIEPRCDGEQLDYIMRRRESLQVMRPDCHYFTTYLLPLVKLYTELHKRITTSFRNGLNDIEQTHHYIKSGEFNKKHMLLKSHEYTKLQ